jgi:hypothetical protein
MRAFLMLGVPSALRDFKILRFFIRRFGRHVRAELRKIRICIKISLCLRTTWASLFIVPLWLRLALGIGGF